MKYLRVTAVTAVAAMTVVVGLAAGVPAHAGDVSTNFSRCPTNAVADVPLAPRATGKPTKPTGTRTTVPISQISHGQYQQIGVRVANQQVPMLLDTGSSWMVINHKVIAWNPQLHFTGQHAAVSYSGGKVCVSGPVVTGPVSVGGLRPRVVTFLLATGGNFPYPAIFGINTWTPPSSFLSIPLRAMHIGQFQLTLTQRTFSPTARGEIVFNGQPAIHQAAPRDVLTFNNPALAGGNRIYVRGWLTSSSGRRTYGSFMLDIGTPYNYIAFFPPAARAMGYNYAHARWVPPGSHINVVADPSDAPALLMPVDGPVTTVGKDTVSFTDVTDPRNGLLGLAGTSAVVGADYVRPWILGVRYTPTGSVVQLLKR